MNGHVVINSTWSQIERNSFNSKQVFSDNGTLDYTKTYSSGTGPSQINSIFYEAGVLSASGGIKTFNLVSMTGSTFGSNTIENFTGVKSLTIKNSSSDVNANLNLIVSTGNGFDSIFGNPTGTIRLSASGEIHKNSNIGIPVISSDRLIVLQNESEVPCYYEILIMGNK